MSDFLDALPAIADEIKAIEIDAPIYVTSLARSGTTVVTEMLAEHAAVTSHRYSDFPAVWTPYWRNWLESRAHNPPATPVERAHGDRIQITNDSPEAVEELIRINATRPLIVITRNTYASCWQCAVQHATWPRVTTIYPA